MMIVTKKETVASLALLVLAAVFLYLGFLQERPQLAKIAGAPHLEQAPAAGAAGVAGGGQAGAPAAGKTGLQAAGKAAPTAAPAKSGTPVSSGTSGLPQPAQNPLEGPQAGALREKTGEDFFVEYRLERDRVRSREVEMLREVIENPNSSAEVRNEAQQRLIRISEYLEQEMQLEALLKAKGYSEAAVFIHPSAVNVIVRVQQLKDEDVNRIGDLAARVTGRRPEEVVITPWP